MAPWFSVNSGDNKMTIKKENEGPYPLITMECPITDKQKLTIICWMLALGESTDWTKRRLSFVGVVFDCNSSTHTNVPLNIPEDFTPSAKIRTAIDQTRDFFLTLFDRSDIHLAEMSSWYTNEEKFKGFYKTIMPFDPLLETAPGEIDGVNILMEGEDEHTGPS